MAQKSTEIISNMNFEQEKPIKIMVEGKLQTNERTNTEVLREIN